MRHVLTMAVAVSLLLTGCEDRNNPVAEADPSEVQQWLVRLETDAMKHCAELWKAPETAPVDTACDSEKQRIAAAMNSGGFSNVEVKPEDLELKAVWLTYSSKLAERMEKQKQTQESLQEIDETLGQFSKKRKGER